MYISVLVLHLYCTSHCTLLFFISLSYFQWYSCMRLVLHASQLLALSFVCLQDNFGYDLPAVEAAMKKHEAIEADIESYEERIGVIVELAVEMEKEGYYDNRRISARKENILGQWSLLKELVAGRRTRLEKNLALQKTFQDMVYMIDWMEDTQVLGEGFYGLYGVKMQQSVKLQWKTEAGVSAYVFLIIIYPVDLLKPLRSSCCQRTSGSIFWRWTICCRSTVYRKPILLFRLREWRRSTMQRFISPQ